MDEQNQALLQALYDQLNGDADHDADVLMDWAERYRDDPDAAPLLTEIGRLLFRLDPQENEALTQETIDKTLRMRDGALSDARRLSQIGRLEEALELLQPWLTEAETMLLSEDCLWMDFQSFLDGMLFQDYFEEEIDGREIRRHPLRPGILYYTCSCLLVELERYDEALELLDALLGLDPVCPQYLFELTDTLKRVGRIEEAANFASWTLDCVSGDADLARCYRDLGYCKAEAGAWEDAAALYQLSVRFQTSPLVEDELRWIAEQSGEPVRRFSEEALQDRCDALGIRIGISDAVKHNLELLEGLAP